LHHLRPKCEAQVAETISLGNPIGPASTTRRVLTVREAAARVGLSKPTLDKLRVYGGGPVYIKIGRRVVYDPADIDSWLATHRRVSTSEHSEVA
jgi:predicted DNA-binding transcriptional regulator AlpA